MAQEIGYKLELAAVRSGFDGHRCWVHARAGAIPGAGAAGRPAVVLTMQELLLAGSDVFYALNDMRTDDLGQTWQGPREHETLGRREEANGVVAVICDFTPKFHRASGKLLGIGHVARYVGDELMPSPRPRQTAYSVYDERAHTWSPWATLQMPAHERFFSAGAGCVQRVDLPDGTLLVPIYFHGPEARNSTVTVMRCAFDGERLTYLEHGDEMTVQDPRGLGEPSLTRFQGRSYLTLRNDVRGYVTVGDGLGFSEPRPWVFDDGTELGNYNTQQHWVTHDDGLFLVYTRRGAQNDHVFRHRAPLFMAQVDPERLCVLRGTEQTLVPERGARLGNFGVCEVSQDETWVIAAEWMQPIGCEKYGSDNTVFLAKLHWERPNGWGVGG